MNYWFKLGRLSNAALTVFIIFLVSACTGDTNTSSTSSSSSSSSSSSGQGNNVLVGNESEAIMKSGRQSWQGACEDCHGADGQGGVGYPKPLNLSRFALREDMVTYIYQQMPPGEGDQPKLGCDLQCANDTADFIIAGLPVDPDSLPLTCNGNIEEHANPPIRLLTSSQFRELVERVYSKVNVEVSPQIANAKVFQDVKVAGFKNNAGVTLDGNNIKDMFGLAMDIGQQVANKFSSLMSCDAGQESCVRQYINEYGGQLFRREPSLEHTDELVLLHKKNSGPEGIAHVTAAMILSPNLLYTFEEDVLVRTPLKPRELAARMAFLLWNTTPDAALLAAADSGVLNTVSGIEAKAEEMLRDDRAFDGLRSFYDSYVALDPDFEYKGSNANWQHCGDEFGQCNFQGEKRVRYGINDKWNERTLSNGTPCSNQVFGDPSPGTNKVCEIFIGINDGVSHALTAAQASDELTRFVSDLTLRSEGSFEDLMMSPKAFVDETTAKIYAVENGQLSGAPEYQGGKQVLLDSSKRAGIITRIAFVLHGGGDRVGLSSPTLRGEHLLKTMFCQSPPPAPGDVEFPDVPDDPNLTWVDVIKQFHLVDDDNNPDTPNPCIECHLTFDPLGFAFENYAFNGEYVSQYLGGQMVDASGEVHPIKNDPKDIDGSSFNDAIELSEIIAKSDDAATCFSNQWLTYAVARDIAENSGDQCAAEELAREFKSSGYTLKELLIALVKSPSFRFRNPEVDAQ